MLSKQNLAVFYNDVITFAADLIEKEAAGLVDTKTMSREQAQLMWVSGKDLQEIAAGKRVVASSLGDAGVRSHGQLSGDDERRQQLYSEIYSTANTVVQPVGNVTVERNMKVVEEDGRFFLDDHPHEVDFGKAWYGGFQMYAIHGTRNKRTGKFIGPSPGDEVFLAEYIKGADVLITATFLCIEKIIEYEKGLFIERIRKL